MFPNEYFPEAYFADDYWPQSGGAAVITPPAEPEVEETTGLLTVRAMKIADWYDIHLDEDNNATWGHFYPAAGGPRRRMLVILEKTRGLDEGQHTTDVRDQIRVFFGRDVDHAKGGVEDVFEGDAFHIEGDPCPYHYTADGSTGFIDPSGAFMEVYLSRVRWIRDIGKTHRMGA